MSKEVITNVVKVWESVSDLVDDVLNWPEAGQHSDLEAAARARSSPTVHGQMTTRFLLRDGNGGEIVLPVQLVMEATFDDSPPQAC